MEQKNLVKRVMLFHSTFTKWMYGDDSEGEVEGEEAIEETKECVGWMAYRHLGMVGFFASLSNWKQRF
ncbi:hypothetical protein BRO54_0870 [Geobacillus proteiniphilus]|uniref:Uncharacterized protein n=1 Tax=Geobacillus proteiniphilus TaxID=860353 RepID=A0A1Q5T5I8_9BACL|nr:hypothetical protein BRO54_0870 [Geobacillus proteiniphilus]